MAPKRDVVLVTGSSGCLGQHVVKLLQEQDDHTAEIRLFDRISYENKLGHSEDKKMTEYVGDIRNINELLEAMEGVGCVMHLAAVIDLRLIPDDKTMESVNVDGTQAVIDACLRKNVPRLIYASSTEVMFGAGDIFYGSESTTPKPEIFMRGVYAESKWKAEELVLKASGQTCSDGETLLRTVSLRASAFYGEEDRYFVTPILRMAKAWSGVHRRVKRRDGDVLQCIYAGNFAWAFLGARERLSDLDETVSGEEFLITDDTALGDVHEFLRPYLEARGFAIGPRDVPYWLAWSLLRTAEWALRVLRAPRLGCDLPSASVLTFFCRTFFYDRTKAAVRLDYRPLYAPEEAELRSLAFYGTVDLG